MIATQLSQLEPDLAKGLCLQFILHEVIKSLSIAKDLQPASMETADLLWQQLLSEPGRASYGSLDKLCFYSKALVQSSKVGEALLYAIEDLHSSASTHLSRLQRGSPTSLDLYSGLQQLYPTLSATLKECADSEVAMFTLLELRAEFNRLFSAGLVETLLAELFPEGPSEMRNQLTLAFERRGFIGFCEQHSAVFEGLAWPSAPHKSLCTAKS